MKRVFIFIVIALLLAATGLVYYKTKNKSVKIDEVNMCQNDELITKLIINNSNPFSKFKYIKKRNDDCKLLLYNNREAAMKIKKKDFCSYLDASTNSVTVLINTYVHDMYDRESASKELKVIAPLMTPYNYCDEYMTNMITLIQIKKKLGL